MQGWGSHSGCSSHGLTNIWSDFIAMPTARFAHTLKFRELKPWPHHNFSAFPNPVMSGKPRVDTPGRQCLTITTHQLLMNPRCGLVLTLPSNVSAPTPQVFAQPKKRLKMLHQALSPLVYLHNRTWQHLPNLLPLHLHTGSYWRQGRPGGESVVCGAKYIYFGMTSKVHLSVMQETDNRKLMLMIFIVNDKLFQRQFYVT